MAKTGFDSAETYLFQNKSWAGKDTGADEITTDDLFQTTELMFLAHLSMAEDTDRQLQVLDLGRIHLRLLYIAVKKPGKTVGEVLSFLRVTNQNIHRPLGELVEKGYVEQRTSSQDRRKRELHATKKGEDLFDMIMRLQFDRLRAAYSAAGRSAIRDFWKVLWNILDESDREWLLRSARD
ncbi:MAG: MarR family transcriptional regulator [Alphaproteobacteria bacterium]|nr:MarR family transcriptional regulator [Alphaproteobacteria bacterium]